MAVMLYHIWSCKLSTPTHSGCSYNTFYMVFEVAQYLTYVRTYIHTVITAVMLFSLTYSGCGYNALHFFIFCSYIQRLQQWGYCFMLWTLWHTVVATLSSFEALCHMVSMVVMSYSFHVYIKPYGGLGGWVNNTSVDTFTLPKNCGTCYSFYLCTCAIPINAPLQCIRTYVVPDSTLT